MPMAVLTGYFLGGRALIFRGKQLLYRLGNTTIYVCPSCVKRLVIINTRDQGGRKYNFFSKKLITHPNFPSNFHTIRKSPKNFISQHVQAFYVMIILTILKNPIKNRFKDKHLTATYNLIALNLKESSHINYVHYQRG